MILAPTLLLNAGSGAAIARPTFSRDFAGEKTLSNGTGPAITFTRASNATFFDASGTLQTASNDTPRFDHSGGSSLGLLIEEARTNSIRNSQGGGAVAGTPGTLPTNWSSATIPHNLTREIVATGTVNGMAYVDVRYSGTANTTSGTGVFIEPTGVVAASPAQTWSASAYLALVGGTLDGTNGVFLSLHELNSTTVLSTLRSSSLKTTITSSLRRFSAPLTTTDATITHVRPFVEFNYTSGAAIDLTLRIAAPQLEQGAFATSYIPTTTAAATRAADSAVVTPISSFYNQAEGTLFVEAIANNIPLSGQFPRPMMIGNATNNNNRIEFYTFLSSGVLGIGSGVIAASNNEYGVFGAASAVGSAFKASTAVATNDFRTAVNGSLFGSADTSGILPDVSTMTHLFVGRQSTGIGAGTSFYIRKIAYYPRRLSNSLLQQLTT